jgi:hypothetical protein
VLSLLPFAIAGDSKRNRSYKYEIKTVDEKLFRPSPLYVQKSMLQPEVLTYLAERGYRKSVYMIVGIRIGRDAKISYGRDIDTHGHVSVTAPGAVTGIPIDLSGEVHAKRAQEMGQEQRIREPFVFAYRLREIRYWKKTKIWKDHAYTRGAELANLDSGESIATIVPEPEVKYVGTEDEIEVEGIAGMDFIEDEEDTRSEDGCIIVP